MKPTKAELLDALKIMVMLVDGGGASEEARYLHLRDAKALIMKSEAKP